MNEKEKADAVLYSQLMATLWGWKPKERDTKWDDVVIEIILGSKQL